MCRRWYLILNDVECFKVDSIWVKKNYWKKNTLKKINLHKLFFSSQFCVLKSSRVDVEVHCFTITGSWVIQYCASFHSQRCKQYPFHFSMDITQLQRAKSWTLCTLVRSL